MQPNVLMIMTDQHHAGCLGHRGHPDVKTPNLDRLAADGASFSECFAQSGTCVPSRVSYLTGQYCHAHGVYGNDLDAIPSRLLSLPAFLQRYGYQTALIGKKHLPHWQTHGFQYERLCYHADAPLRNLHYYNDLRKQGLQGMYDHLGDVERYCLSDLRQVPLEHSLEVWTGNETLAYLRQSRDAGRPFFLQTSFERPHPPLTVPDGCRFIYDPEAITLPENIEELPLGETFFFDRNVEMKWCVSSHGERALREALCAYYALISLIDQQCGRILAGLDELGIRENTVVLFCSDHGDFAGEYGKMAKGWHYDCVHRVPFIWNWPGRIPAGKVFEGFAESVDVFPTLCALCGLPTPKTVQGEDLTPVFDGKESEVRDAVFYESIGVKTVRTKRFKLNYGWDGKQEIGELFDLQADPHEYTNLFASDALLPVREQLLRRLCDWVISTQQPAAFAPAREHLPPSRWFRCHDSAV